jgi:hypothetical protein
VKEGKNFFFEKKKQKTFVNFDRAGFISGGPKSQKFFAEPWWASHLFFKKATSF